MRLSPTICHVMTECRDAALRTLGVVVTVIVMAALSQPAAAQKTISRNPSDAKTQKAQGSSSNASDIKPQVKAWRMIDDYTQSDTVVVDTIIAEHQVHNPIWRRSLANVTLGNLGSPSIPTFYPAFRRDEGNTFYTALEPIMLDPTDFTFFNTKTPYANLTYQKGIPKARREEFFSALFTQNVNRKVNLDRQVREHECLQQQVRLLDFRRRRYL